MLCSRLPNRSLRYCSTPLCASCLLFRTHGVMWLMLPWSQDLDSPDTISGLSMSPLLYQITRVVVLSALSSVVSEMLGFKLCVYCWLAGLVRLVSATHAHILQENMEVQDVTLTSTWVFHHNPLVDARRFEPPSSNVLVCPHV